MFIIAVPFAVTIIQFINISDVRVRIGIPGLVTVILVFYVIRKTLLGKALDNLKIRIAYLSAQSEIETDGEKLLNIIKCLKSATALYIGLTAGTDYVTGEVLIKSKLKLSFIQKFLEQRKENVLS